MKTVTRRMKASDLDECAAIVDATDLFRNYHYSGDSARLQLEGAISSGADVLLVAVNDEKVVGFAWFVPRGAFARSGYLRLITVDPAAKRSGAGRALLTALEGAYLSPNGLFLMATASNAEAQAFYSKLGYRKVGELPDYVRKGMTEAIYFKPA